MGLFTPRDPGFDMSVRQTGFNRYKQLLSIFAEHWLKINLFTIVGALPLATGIVLSILSSSVLVLIPSSIIGGMIFAPFLASMYDAILRGLRDTFENWWTAYKKSWKQNWRESLVPGAFFGLMVGMYAFMAGLMWWAQVLPSLVTIVLYLFAGLLFLLLNTLYWPQLVLFRQTTLNRLRNIVLFTAKYLWRVLGVALLQLAYILLYILLAPWTLVLVPLLGAWYIIFLSLFFLYTPLNQELQIEEQFTGRSLPDDTQLGDN